MRNTSRIVNMAALPASPEAKVIPTRSFYSSRQISPKLNSINLKENGQKSPILSHPGKTKRKSISKQSSINTNKGVKHHIRRRHRQDATQSLEIDSILSNIRNQNLRNRIETNRQSKKQIQEVHNILRKSRNPIELARPLRALNMTDDTNNNNISASSNDITESATETGEFSDLDSFSDDMSTDETKTTLLEIANDNEKDMESSMTTLQENVDNTNISTSRPDTPNENRKFFKSGLTAGIAKEVRITDNIKAMVCNGKITLISEKRKVRGRRKAAVDFSVAQAAVDVIIKNLGDASEAAKIAEKPTDVEEKVENAENVPCNDALLNEIELLETNDYSDFRKRIPYKTDDPVKTEEQHFLLDFLISHNICDENTFNIFIADPENHKHEATKIVNEVLADDDFGQRIPFNTDDPAVIEQQKHFLEFLITHNLLTEENFDIFIANYEKRRPEADAILANVLLSSAEDVINIETEDTKPITDPNSAVTSKTNNDIVLKENIQSPRPMETDATESVTAQNLFPIFYPGQCRPLVKNFTRRSHTWNGGYGTGQYQIDAGQKEFGAKQCKQCGLVYGAHEPEEEKLHRDFHSSLHVLRFKGWIDEDRVADYPEWGRDGRIIRITDSANTKRRERLNEILKIVDKELGFSSYIIPETFVAYLAIRNCLIVGFCLVQPLKKANKYICSNGVDCCTIEEFEAKCGISRIWVAPLHRRMNIAKKLLQAVQVNTIMGEEISCDKIAFSAPTEDGKRLAQKVTGNESFLVYQ